MVEQLDLEKEISEIQDPKALRVIAYLLQRIQLLEEKIARLERNSTNSSKPPSSDITKPVNEQRRPGERRIGAQARHPGKQRDMLPPEKVDHRVPLTIDVCPIHGTQTDFRRNIFWRHGYRFLQRLCVLRFAQAAVLFSSPDSRHKVLNYLARHPYAGVRQKASAVL